MCFVKVDAGARCGNAIWEPSSLPKALDVLQTRVGLVAFNTLYGSFVTLDDLPAGALAG